MASTPSTKKMAQVVKDDGSVEFKFSHGPIVAAALSDYPPEVRDFFALLGMRTKLRNFTVPDEDEKESTPERMHEKLVAGIERLKRGELRVTRSGEDKPAASTLILEAALIYRRMKAAIREHQDPSKWHKVESLDETGAPETIESLRPLIERMEDTITNEADVVAAVAKAEGEGKSGDDLEAIRKKATVTQLDQLKGTALFKAAMAEAKDVRAQKAKHDLLAKAAEEAKNSPI